MPINQHFPPEGLHPHANHTLQSLKSAAETGEILEGFVQRCSADLTLHLSLNGIPAEIPRSEANAPWINGASRDISVLSLVGKQISFTVKSVCADEKGAPLVLLSRRDAQERAMERFLKSLKPGMILTCRILRTEPFGAFADIGCGIVALLPIERISVSRIAHPAERFRAGDTVLAAVLSFDPQRRRITLTQRELLGTWMENASRFSPGETVRGTVRSIQDYGAFIELTPNLSGLADSSPDLCPGDGVSVYIKSLRPENMKIKLHIIERLPQKAPDPLQYQITDGQLERWVYSPPNCEKIVETDFTTPAP